MPQVAWRRSVTPKVIAKKIAELAQDKKAQDIVVLDMRSSVNFCDYFVICSGTSDRHVHAIAEGIEEGLAKINQPCNHVQGLRESLWVVFDMGDIITHIFQTQSRGFYQLEHLWQDAPIVPWQRKKKS